MGTPFGPLPYTLDENGIYYCVVSNDCGSVTSNSFTFNVIPPPVIIQQPTDIHECGGGNQSFSVIVTGTIPLNYQWINSSDNYITGATQSTYTPPSTLPAGQYEYLCQITSFCGNIWTDNVSLYIDETNNNTITKYILLQYSGNNLSCNIAVSSGNDILYQWYQNGTILEGATQSIYNKNSASIADAGTYTCILSNLWKYKR